MKLHGITQGQTLSGVEPNQNVSVVAVVPVSEGTIQLIYRTPSGSIKECLVSQSDAEAIAPATTERPFSFDGDGAALQLACEAKRIDLAFLFDPMMAVHTSNNVEPLPRQPLRFVLIDDTSVGKIIMAGLYIRELILRADAYRVLIVAPGSLVEQWRDELYGKGQT